MSDDLNEHLLKSTCQICLENIEKGENIAIPPCDCKNLLYHAKCYYKWLEKSPTCPTCREPIVIITSEEEEEEEEDSNNNSPNSDHEGNQQDYQHALQEIIQEWAQEHQVLIRTNPSRHEENNSKKHWSSCILQVGFFSAFMYFILLNN